MHKCMYSKDRMLNDPVQLCSEIEIILNTVKKSSFDTALQLNMPSTILTEHHSSHETKKVALGST